MKTLELFNAVVSKESSKSPLVTDDGYIIEPGALWAEKEIIDFYSDSRFDLNATFHKSWKKVKDSSRYELLVEQISHYVSTYGSEFESDVYIPNEVLDLPDVKLTYKVIKAYTKSEMIEKCLGMLRSGMALKEETIDSLLTVLTDELSYTFTGSEGIRNKEAIIKIADLYGVLPTDVMDYS
jgi:hypothetical protein